MGMENRRNKIEQTNSTTQKEIGQTNTVSKNEVEQEPQIPQKVKEINEFIKGKSFEGKVVNHNEGMPVWSENIVLKFDPSNPFEGKVSIQAIKEVMGTKKNLSETSNGIETGVSTYSIQDNGEINIGRITLVKYGFDLKSDMKGILRQHKPDSPSGFKDSEHNVLFHKL